MGAAVFSVALLAGCTFAVAQEAALRFDNHRIVQVEVATAGQLEVIESLGTILNCHPRPGPVDVLVTSEQIAELNRLGFRPRILQADVQGMVDRQRLGAIESVVAGADPFADFFLNYHPYDGAGGIVWFLNELVVRYPALASMVNVGTTLEGRTIWGVKITAAAAAKPGVLYFGCEHAREWVACTHPAYVAKHLVENYGVDPAITDLVDNVELYLVPVFNVDGYIYSWTTNRFWRKNRRSNGNGAFGVDLNRNWAEGWGGVGSSGVTSNETYRGTAPFSEPETQALRDFFLAHPNIRAQLDVHSYSQLILWPHGYTSSLPPDQAAYLELGAAMQSAVLGVHGVLYLAGPVYTTIYPASGVSVDWTYTQLGVLSLSYEARDTGTYGFTLPAAQIIPNNEELLPATLLLSNSDWVRSPLRFEFPAGVPASIDAGEDTVVGVRIVEQFDTIEPGTAMIHYRHDPAAAFSQAPLQTLGGDEYQAVLPATNCFSLPQFYFSVEGASHGWIAKPSQSPSAQFYTVTVTENGSPSCVATLGDANGDGIVNEVDFPTLAACFSGEGQPYGPGCRIMDFTVDGDVDCDDAGRFQAAWGAAEPPPVMPLCIGPTLAAGGARYLRITPPPVAGAMALRLTSADYPCLTRYVDFDSNASMAAQGVARLVDAPVYRTAAEWGELLLADVGIVPESRFEVWSEVPGAEPSSHGTAETTMWADVAAPFGTVDALDITALVQRFRGLPGAPPLSRCDLYPAVPDYHLNALDIAVAVQAFRGLAYPFPTPAPCPP